MLKKIVKMLASFVAIMFLSFMVGMAVVGLLVGLVRYVKGDTGNGIIIMEGFSDGVALCGEEGAGTQAEDDFVAINRSGVYMMVNADAVPDPKVPQLWVKALRECAKYARQ